MDWLSPEEWGAVRLSLEVALRSVAMGVRVVTGISFGFIFYVLDQIFGPLTLVYGIPPIIGALLPSASFFLISLWLMMRKG